MSLSIVFCKTEISSTLSLLNKQYNNESKYSTPSLRTSRLIKIYSKMSLMVICGWLEDGIKDLAKKSEIKLKVGDSKKYLNNSINNIYGFNYDKHFKKAITMAYGIHGAEFIESKIGNSDLAILMSTLGNLKTLRDDAAHSNRAVISYNPSRIIVEFKKILPIVKKIEKYAVEYRNNHF